MLSKKASSSIFKVFGMTRPRIESRSAGPLANTNHYANVRTFYLVISQFYCNSLNPKMTNIFTLIMYNTLKDVKVF